jgi:hypothetical protein
VWLAGFFGEGEFWVMKTLQKTTIFEWRHLDCSFVGPMFLNGNFFQFPPPPLGIDLENHTTPPFSSRSSNCYFQKSMPSVTTVPVGIKLHCAAKTIQWRI